MREILRNSFFKATLLASGAMIAMPALAQDAAPQVSADEQRAGGIGEIVVTARRIEENIQTTPVAVTAIDTKGLIQAQVVNQTDLQRLAPSLSIRKGAPSSSGFTYVAIRGQANLNPGVANDPAVGIYVDGVYIPRPSQGVTDLDDIMRAEVLRGPQGTLFGRNTIGGAINIISNEPTGDLEGSVYGEYGNFNQWTAGGVLNVPLQEDKLAVRGVYKHSQHDGYYHNTFLNRDEGDNKSDFGRVRLRAKPGSGALTIDLSGDYNKIRDSGQAVRLLGINSFLIGPALSGAFQGALAPLFGALQGAGFPVDVSGINLSTINSQFQPYIFNFDTNRDGYSKGFASTSTPNGGRAPYNELEAYGGSLTVSLDLDNLALKSITAYRYSNNSGLIDLDASPIDLIATRSGYLSKQWSQEIQLSGKIGDRVSFITGAYGSWEKGNEFSEFQTFGFLNSYVLSVINDQAGPVAAGVASSVFGLGAPPLTPINNADVKNRSYGLFGQVYVDVTDRLRATAGLRWTFDRREVALHNLAQVGLPASTPLPPQAAATGFNCVNAGTTAANAAACSLGRSKDFDYPAYTLGLDYKASDSLFLYAKHSRASKAGGFNLRQGSEAQPAFRPETTRDVELGLKYTDPGRLFRVNASTFYIWTSDVQRNASALVNNLSTQYFRNAGKTETYGAELEAFVNPVQGLVLNGNISLMHGKYVKGTYFDDLGGGVIVDRSGEPMLQLPKIQYSVGATYTAPVGPGEIALHADFSYIGHQYTNPVTAAPNAPPPVVAQYDIANKIDRTPGYGLLNGRISYTLANGLEVSVFGRNLTDKKYAVNTFTSLYTQLGNALIYPGDPRTYGIGLKFNFGPNK